MFRPRKENLENSEAEKVIEVPVDVADGGEVHTIMHELPVGQEQEVVSSTITLKKKMGETGPVEVNSGVKSVSIEIKSPKGKFKVGGVWYDLPKGFHRVPVSVRDILAVRGDLK